MKEKKDIVKSIVVLFVICLVVSTALAVVNSFTAPVSAANAAERENEARRAVIPDAAYFQPVELSLPDGVVSAYEGVDGSGGTLGYVFTLEGKGFDGTISVMCAIGTDGKILRVRTLDVSSETKTLGGRTANPEYTDQYTGQDANLSGVNAISGATITSTAYRGCVEAAFEAFEVIKEAGK